MLCEVSNRLGRSEVLNLLESVPLALFLYDEGNVEPQQKH